MPSSSLLSLFGGPSMEYHIPPVGEGGDDGGGKRMREGWGKHRMEKDERKGGGRERET